MNTPLSTNSAIFPRVTLPGTEVRTIKSANTHRSYDIHIRLPAEYGQNPDMKYPVLYVLDGQWDFKLLDSITGGLFYDGCIPETIIVGITYTGDNPNYEALRAKDYTPLYIDAIPDSGGAPKFLEFFKGELFPFIENNYLADSSQRVLMGCSFGGTFSLFAMFEDPRLFTGYVVASPAVPYAENAVFKQEEAYAHVHQDLPVKLFLSVGELERLTQPVLEFMRVVRERNYSGLILKTRTIEGEKHSGNKPEAFNRGLRFIFQK